MFPLASEPSAPGLTPSFSVVKSELGAGTRPQIPRSRISPTRIATSGIEVDGNQSSHLQCECNRLRSSVIRVRLATQWSEIALVKVAKSDEAIKQAIRASGLRATPARIATLAYLRDSKSPVTHAMVADYLAGSAIDKATVFRNLNDLVDAGLLRRTELGDHVWRFEAVDAIDDPPHPHFVCVDCGTVSCMQDVKLTAGSQRQSESIGEVTEILLRGHCNGCR